MSQYQDLENKLSLSDPTEERLLEKDLISNSEPTKLDTSFFEKISQQEMEDLDDFLCEIIDELFEDEIINMSKPNFFEIIADNIKEHFKIEWLSQNICSDQEFEEICDYIDTFLEKTFDDLECEIPKRQYPSDFSGCIRTPRDELKKQIEYLKSLPQPEQKSKEWYELRHNLITASNIHKILGSELQRNSIIYEKCKPLTIENQNYFVNANNTRQWGIVYEPLSIQIYEKLYKTSVDSFGCIRHPKYSYIGASPDGINIDPNSSRFGRMIEVKNIVNRDITGIPKEEHWIQMQIQMETCDLDECDFIETRFKEYENNEDFYTDETKYRWRGVLLCFLEKKTDSAGTGHSAAYIPRFEYMPLDVPINRESVDKWINDICISTKDTHRLFTTHYWYLDEFSCILVKRNRMWFKAALPKILETWKTIEYEREHGYEHRASKKRDIPGIRNIVPGMLHSDLNTPSDNAPGALPDCLIATQSGNLRSPDASGMMSEGQRPGDIRVVKLGADEA
jgi:putative phage-type endonuclease